MALRVACPVLLLLLTLLTAGLAVSGRPSCTRRNTAFLRRHVDYPQTPAPQPGAYCDSTMRAQGLYGRRLHTFIHVRVPLISLVCSVGGTPLANGARRSNAYFTVTTCRYHPPTDSYSQSNRSRKIALRCCRGLPVLYEEKL